MKMGLRPTNDDRGALCMGQGKQSIFAQSNRGDEEGGSAVQCSAVLYYGRR